MLPHKLDSTFLVTICFTFIYILFRISNFSQQWSRQCRYRWMKLRTRTETRWVTSTYDRKPSVSCLMRELAYNGKHCRSVAEFNVRHLCTRFSMVKWQCQPNWLTWNLRRSRGDYNQQKLYSVVCSRFIQPRTHTTEYQKSFVHRTIPEWNSLPSSVAQSDTVSTFKALRFSVQRNHSSPR